MSTVERDVRVNRNCRILKRLMKQYEKTAPEIADLVSVHPQTVYAWRGKQQECPDNVITLLKLLLK